MVFEDVDVNGDNVVLKNEDFLCLLDILIISNNIIVDGNIIDDDHPYNTIIRDSGMKNMSLRMMSYHMLHIIRSNQRKKDS